MYSVSARDSPASQWDRNTWPALENLARNHPEAGVHFQSESPAIQQDVASNWRQLAEY